MLAVLLPAVIVAALVGVRAPCVCLALGLFFMLVTVAGLAVSEVRAAGLTAGAAGL